MSARSLPLRHGHRALALAALLASGLGTVRQAGAQVTGAPKSLAELARIPAAMRAEHAEIHETLARATKLPGRVGEAARQLAAVLDPHFVREEQIALPPLGLLVPLASGQYSPVMRGILPMTDSLRAEYPKMLREHVAIRTATLHLGEVARAAGNAEVAHLAETLAIHAQNEEEVFYPAALLVGEVVRARQSGRGTSP